MNANGSTPIDIAYQCVPINKDTGCTANILNYGYSSIADKPNINFNCRVCDSPFKKIVALNSS